MTFARRLCTHWQIKILAGCGISAGFFTGYFFLQHAQLFPVRIVPAIWIDHWIGFHPTLSWMYVSLWLYMSIVPWLTIDRVVLLRYAKTLCAICIIGLMIFAAYPTAVIRPSAESVADPLFRSLVRFDGAGNACPSLHATFAVFSALCISDFIPRTTGASIARIASWIWCIGIMYSTVAIKEHVVVDVLAGIPIGACAWIFYRRPQKAAA